MSKGIGQFLILIVMCASLVGCGKSKDKKKKRKQAKQTIQLNIEEIDKIMDSQFFTCDTVNNSDDCPDGIARVFIFNQYEPDKSSVCTGFLIDNDVLITNKHCVSHEEDCRNTYISVHGQGDAHTAQCSYILASNSNGSDNLNTRTVDYSILKLDRSVDVNPINVSTVEVKNQEKLSTFVVDQLDIHHGRIVEFECEAEIPGFVASTLMINCPIIAGNSGSPVFNSQNDAVGIIWGATSNGHDLDIYTSLSDRRSTNSYGIMTEFRFFSDDINNSIGD